MRELATILAVEIPESGWPALVRAATSQNMKDNAEMLVPEADKDMWNGRQGFFNKGTVDQWQGVLGDEELTLYRTAIEKRLDPELVEWLENGCL
jgi:aryl sulfotransferase